MGTIKKRMMRKAQDGETLRECRIDKEGNRNCGPIGQGSPAISNKRIRWTKKESEESDRQMMLFNLRRKKPISTAPGVRPGEKSGEYKKGSKSFFGGEKNVVEAKRGKKVVKRAKVGKKVVSKSKKK
jgi:hypothetical protein